MRTHAHLVAGTACFVSLLPAVCWSAAEVIPEIYHDISAPLSSMSTGRLNAAAAQQPLRTIPLRGIPAPVGSRSGISADTALQTSAGPLISVTAGINVDGVGNGFTGPQGTFTVSSAPSDSNGAVGSTQYVQWVNSSFAVFNKSTGAVVYGPAAGNTLWTGFGGQCELQNDGDPVVQYDKAANRWVLTQFAVNGGVGNYFQCVAVSVTSDATGSYYRYAFPMPNFNDYPKLGVWPDAYYASFNMFSGSTGAFVGGRACAFDRSKMLAGTAATAVCFQLSSAYGGLLPSDLDGSTAPPAGSPNYFLSLGTTSSLYLWKFHVDFTTPSNSTFTGPTSIPVSAYSTACGGGTCIPQPGTTQQLDSLGDRLMHRLAYRNFGDHEAVVANHSVVAGSGSGVRWYELRNPGAAAPTVYQQGTYAPDSTSRWMGSIGMDRVGNIAVGYSASSSSLFPSVLYTGRLIADTQGTLESENTIIGGGGSQTGGLNRWGDYTALTVDPVDDCTFWYTDQYLKSTGSFNWSTRIASFKFSSCVPATGSHSIVAILKTLLN
jgi:hypothetical protein